MRTRCLCLKNVGPCFGRSCTEDHNTDQTTGFLGFGNSIYVPYKQPGERGDVRLLQQGCQVSRGRCSRDQACMIHRQVYIHVYISIYEYYMCSSHDHCIFRQQHGRALVTISSLHQPSSTIFTKGVYSVHIEAPNQCPHMPATTIQT